MLLNRGVDEPLALLPLSSGNPISLIQPKPSRRNPSGLTLALFLCYLHLVPPLFIAPLALFRTAFCLGLLADHPTQTLVALQQMKFSSPTSPLAVSVCAAVLLAVLLVVEVGAKPSFTLFAPALGSSHVIPFEIVPRQALKV